MTALPARLGRWLSCERCKLKAARQRVCLGMGVLPCDLFVVLEAPQRPEDALGVAVAPPSMRLLDTIFETAAKVAATGKAYTRYHTNAVACRPAEGRTEPNRAPEPAEVLACFQRLELEYKLAAPRRTVVFGDVAKDATRALIPGALALPPLPFIMRQGGQGSTVFVHTCRALSALLCEMEK